MCMECPNDSVCSLTQIMPHNSSKITSKSSIQPDLLDYEQIQCLRALNTSILY
jgi:hypothetical protein